MKAELLNEHGGLRTFVLVLDSGEEAIRTITSFAEARELRATQFSAIGAFSRVVVAYFEWATKQYRNIAIPEQVEVLSLLGDITLEAGKPKVHAHCVIGKADATAHGGHLVEGIVRPTLEVVLSETPAHLKRRFDPETGLALIQPGTRVSSRPRHTSR